MKTWWRGFAVASAIAALTLTTMGGCDEAGEVLDGLGLNLPDENGKLKAGGTGHSTSGSSWTWLVYQVADNNLEPFALSDLQEMMQVGSGGGLNIVVQSDRTSGYSSDPVGGLSDWVSSKRLRVEAGQLVELQDLGETNTGDPAVLADFIEWGVKTFPADRYALIFWDHGGAWPGFGGDDDNGHDLLSLAELKEGLKNGMQAAGLSRFGLIGYDACLMATYETAMAMQPYGEYLLASEELEPGHGWNYESLGAAKSNPSISPLDLGKQIADGFKAQAASEGESKVTLSVIDLTLVDQLQKAVDALARALNGKEGQYGTLIGQQRAKALEFGLMPGSNEHTAYMLDLDDFATLIAQASGDLQGTADGIHAAVANVVKYNVTDSLMSRAKGVSIYFPPRGQYDSKYASLPEATEWKDFLNNYHDAGGNIPQEEQPEVTSEQGSGGWSDGEATVRATVDADTADNIAEALAFFGVVEEGYIAMVADGPATVSGNEVSASWDATVLTLSQSGNEAYAYMSVMELDGATSVTVPFAMTYDGAESSVGLEIVIQGDQIISETFYQYEEYGVGELYPDPTMELLPILPVVTGGGVEWQSTTQTPFDPSQQIDLGLMQLEQGTEIYLEVDIYDYVGNSSYASLTTTVGGGSTGPVCGDGNCDPGEDQASCPQDCGGGDVCDTMPAEGRCNGDVAEWCFDGELQSEDCFDIGCDSCGWDDTNGYYGCLGCPF